MIKKRTPWLIGAAAAVALAGGSIFAVSAANAATETDTDTVAVHPTPGNPDLRPSVQEGDSAAVTVTEVGSAPDLDLSKIEILEAVPVDGAVPVIVGDSGVTAEK
jgi:hypothetical protein